MASSALLVAIAAIALRARGPGPLCSAGDIGVALRQLQWKDGRIDNFGRHDVAAFKARTSCQQVQAPRHGRSPVVAAEIVHSAKQLVPCDVLVQPARGNR